MDKEVKKLSPLKVTKQQREWLESESARTGSTMAQIVRDLIQVASKKKS